MFSFFNLDGVCVCLCVCVRAHARSVISDSTTLWTIALQALLSMGFPRQDYWETFVTCVKCSQSPPGLFSPLDTGQIIVTYNYLYCMPKILGMLFYI